MSSRISYKVTGEVQGVFFRQSTVRKAGSIGVTGFVRNASDGSVMGEAQGDEYSLQTFIDFLHQGPPQSRVAKVEHEEISMKDGEQGFVQK